MEAESATGHQHNEREKKKQKQHLSRRTSYFTCTSFVCGEETSKTTMILWLPIEAVTKMCEKQTSINPLQIIRVK